jgi:uncharacterized protein (DUF433 family)
MAILQEERMAHERPPLLDRITQDPEIMVGKPVVRGTRIPADRVIAHLATTLDLDDLFAAYPELTPDDVRAALQYAHERMMGRRPRLKASLVPASAVA